MSFSQGFTRIEKDCKDFIFRKKVREGIILVDFDRRQNSDPYYSGPERREGKDRRNGVIFVDFDRRQNNDHQYSGPERRNGIERRNGFAAVSSQPGRRL